MDSSAYKHHFQQSEVPSTERFALASNIIPLSAYVEFAPLSFLQQLHTSHSYLM
jgi:hypothetical protein